MLIQINDKYRITSDPLNIIVEKLTTPKEEEGKEKKAPSWRAEGYYPNLEYACMGLLKHRICKSDAQTITELKDYIAGVKNEIINAINNTNSVVEDTVTQE